AVARGEPAQFVAGTVQHHRAERADLRVGAEFVVPPAVGALADRGIRLYFTRHRSTVIRRGGRAHHLGRDVALTGVASARPAGLSPALAGGRLVLGGGQDRTRAADD